MSKLKVLSLFAGIGGFDLGLERTGGFQTVAFCEIDPFCRKELAKHWPGVLCYEDVRTLTGDALRRDGIAVDVICGGFPCQDISYAGDRAGLEGERSGLWSEYARLIGELRPHFAIVENTAGLLSLGMGRILGDLAALGFDAEWHSIPASALGAPHRRDRVWIIAHTQREQLRQQSRRGNGSRRTNSLQPAIDGVDADCQSKFGGAIYAEVARRKGVSGDGPSVWERQVGTIQAHALADGLPDDLDDATSALGNAVLPQFPEILGRAILQAEGRT